MLNDTYFSRLVAEDVKNKASDEQQAMLRSPENWERWRRALLDLTENLNAQIEDLDAQLDGDIGRYKRLGKSGKELIVQAQMAYDDRANKIKRFRFYVEQRLVEVERLIAMGTTDYAATDTMLNMLQRSIEAHQTYTSSYGYEPTLVDTALWAAADGRWLFDDLPDEV